MKKNLLLTVCILLIVAFLPMDALAASFSKGNSGNGVIEIQWILKQYGYFTDSATGYYGSATAEAVKNFQSDMGLSTSGTADSSTVSALQSASKRTGTVKGISSSLNVRSDMKDNASVSATLKNGASVSVYSEYDSWCHIKTSDGVWGYVSKSYLTMGSMSGISATVKSGDSLNIRSGAGTGNSVVATAKSGASLTVIGSSGSWFKVIYSGKTGYASKSYIKLGNGSGSTASPTATSGYSSWNGSVNASTLNVRKGAGTGYSVVATIRSGATVTVLGESGSWYYIQISSGTKGYVSKSYISKKASSSTGTITGVSSSLNVRKGAGTGYGVVATLSKGAKVTILGTSGDWYKIRITSGVEGYVHNKYVSAGASSSSSSSGSSLKQPSGTYKLGNNNSSVVTIQKRLKELGYFTSDTTGYYGTITVASVKAFQKANGLTADGVCGTKTLDSIFASSAKSYSNGSSSSSSTSSGNAELGDQIVAYAKQFLGKPYVTGGNGPSTFDCTGLTCYVFKHFGYTLPRTAFAQGYNDYGTRITSTSDLKIGDLVFFNTVSDSDLSDHAGIYIGNGQVIHAASGSSSGKKVIISSFSESYYKTRFSWGRRLF